MKNKVTEMFMYYFLSGKMHDAYQYFGVHKMNDEFGIYTSFMLYAPDCKNVCLITGDDFSKEIPMQHVLEGIWYCRLGDFQEGLAYKYILYTNDDKKLFKGDPFAFLCEKRPSTNSVIFDIFKEYKWHDDIYQYTKKKTYDRPISIYEVHLGSFIRIDDENFYSFSEMAPKLAQYLKELHFTHVELMPIYEHPLDASWGYQGTNYYSVTARYGNAYDLMQFVDIMHQNEIGVILDWVPGHICKDAHGLYMFNGKPLYEYSEYRDRENEVWGTANLDLGKGITKSLLLSNAMFFLKHFHIDGFRVDAVSNLIYYKGDPNKGENKGAIEFLRELSTALFAQDDRILLMAEDSSAYPGVTKPVEAGGLGFNYKWDMGWMNDTLKYFKLDPIHRKFHHNMLSFSMMYYYNEQFILPLSHDEVVHMKGSLLNKMPGEYFQKFANYRLLIGYMITHPGKKLLFMGSELAPFSEWHYESELEWDLLRYPIHDSTKRYFSDLLKLYKEEKAFYELDYSYEGFQWIDADNYEKSIYIFERRAKNKNDDIIVVLNMTPNAYHDYRIGATGSRMYEEIFNSDKDIYGGSNQINQKRIKFETIPMHNRKGSIKITVPPLGVTILKMRKPYNKIGDK